MKKSHFRYWELALLLALAVTILWGAASLGQQEELGRKVIRLHVIANSDSPEDQALKLRVRDRVLARAQEILEQSADHGAGGAGPDRRLAGADPGGPGNPGGRGLRPARSRPGWSRRSSPPRTMTASPCPPGNTWPCG